MAKPPTPIQQARQIVAPQYAPINITAKEQQRQTKAARQATNAATLALVNALKSEVVPAGATYDAGIAQQQALAHDAAAGLAQASPNAQIQSDLAAINAPEQQRSQIAAALGNQFGGQGGVLNIEQGSVPGASLVAQKAATQQFLAGLPSVVALGGQRALSALQQQALQAAAQTAAQRAQVAAQLPGLAMDIANTRSDQAFRQQQLANANQQAALDRAFQAQQAALGRQLTPYEKAQLALSASKTYAPQVIGSSGSGYYQYDPNTGGVRQIIGPVKGSSSSASTGGLPATSAARYRGIANTIAINARNGFTETGGTPSKPTKITHPPLTYDAAIREMEKEGVPLAIAVAALNQVYPAQYRVTKRGLKQVGINNRNIRKRK